MAMIKCPECGNEISDKAMTCPHCGFSLTLESRRKSAESIASKEKILFLLSFVCGLVFEAITHNGWIMGLACCGFIFGIGHLVISVFITQNPLDFERPSIPRKIFAFSVGVIISFVAWIIL